MSAPSGNTAWTWGTTVLLRMPPSGPMKLLSCLMRDTTAKYCGKSLVIIRQMRFLSSSSGMSSSGYRTEAHRSGCVLLMMLFLWSALQVPHRLTLVHAVQDLVQFLRGVFTLMLLPVLSCLTSKDHQLPLSPPEGRKVGDFNDHRAGDRAGIKSQ